MLKNLFGKPSPIAKSAAPSVLPPLPKPAQILKSPDPEVRANAARHPDAPPEVLFVLSADTVAQVRRNVAGNPATPSVVSPVLAKDADVDVRSALLARLVRLLPDLPPDQHGELYQQTVKALETLAQDQVRYVREALANTLKDVAFAPLSVVKTLAQDVEQTVAEPVLQFCSSLTDEDLLEVISRQPGPWALTAIAGRQGVSAPVVNAIVDSGDIPAGSVLLDNNGAAIDETTLESMVDRAPAVPEWQRRLAQRANLPRRLAVRLAEFVDKTVMQLLEKRKDFDAETKQEIVGVTRRRLDYIEQMETGRSADDRASVLHAKGKLVETSILDAISWNDRPFIVAALGLLAKVQPGIVDKVLTAQNGRVITALAWKAGLSMRAAMQLQARIANVPGRDILNARNGQDYPLTEDDMLWQLEFVGALPAKRVS